MKVAFVHLYSQSEPIAIEDVLNTYTKDGLYCIKTLSKRQTVVKFPVQHIFRIIEENH